MLNRFRFLGKYATVAQLRLAVTLDAITLLLLGALAVGLTIFRHPFFALPLILAALFEMVCVGTSLYLISQRRAGSSDAA